MLSQRLCVFFAAALGCAAQSLGPAIYRVGGDVTAPTLLSHTEPEFSDEARRAKLQGTALLSIVVDQDGAVHDVRVVKPLGLGLDENAVSAVSKWTFQPAKRNGIPVPVESTIEVSFNLLARPGEWYPSQVALSAPSDATQPRFLSAQYPTPSERTSFARMRLSFDIDTEGHPVHVHIDDSLDASANDEVMAMIAEWRFEAALRHGIPVESHAVIDLSRGLQPQRPTPVNGRR